MFKREMIIIENVEWMPMKQLVVWTQIQLVVCWMLNLYS